MGCKRKGKRKGCGLMGAMLIVSIVYYGIGILKMLHDRRHPQEYYGTAALMLGQCGSGGCPSPQSPGSGDAWQLPTSSGEPWIYKLNGREVGRINSDGSRVGFASEPTWYPTGMPQAFQRVKATEPANEKPTGVNVEELAKEKANATTGITVNGQPVTEHVLRDKLSESARARGLRDYADVFRIVIVGDSTARKDWLKVAEPFVKESGGKAIVQEFNHDDWHVSAHTHGVKSLPEYRTGETFAFIQTEDDKNNVRAIALTATELGKSLKQLRPEIAPNFDPNKARAIESVSRDWLIVGFVFACIAVMALGLLVGGKNDA